METRESRKAWGVRLAGYLLVFLGASVLIGWIGNIGFLMTVLPGRITMKPNTAIGFLCTGIAIVLLTRRSLTRSLQTFGVVFAAIVTGLGLFTLIEYAFHLNLGIDQLIFNDPMQYPYPGRMAHITALNFCFSGLSLWLLALSRKQVRWPQLLSLLTGLSALLAIVGYVYGVPLLYGSVRYTSMALHTGVGFLLVSLATLHCRPAEGLMSVVSSPFSGGSVCRALIPVAIVAPIVLGAVYIHGHFSLKDARLALACLMVSQVVLFVGLIWALALRLNRAETERQSAKEALHKSEEVLEQNYRSMFEEAIIGIFRTTPDCRFLNVNPAMADIFGYDSPQEMITTVTDIPNHLYVDSGLREEFKLLLEKEGEVRDFECQVFRKDGTKMWISSNARAIRQDGVMVRFDGTFEDITQRKTLEEQLHQAQKMEAIGRLAGGIAHDFNNAIGVIVGYGALLKEGLASNDTLRRYAEEVGNAGHRAASLTRQLLAFSRKQVIQPTILDLNSVVSETEKMLCRLIGEDIDLVFMREPNLRRMRADRGQVDQILMNLAVNARDAMPQGGKLVIQTANAELDETNLSQHAYAKPGRYVMLSVSDTGCGMDKETLSHIFEPFFTTKGEGRGTGLGLSTVYGVVKQSGGYIWVYSELGKGARFKIYFPQVEGAADPVARAGTSGTPGGTETILLVEDDDSMRDLTRTCLRSAGYTVLDVQDGDAAIRAVSEQEGTIHLLLTDVVMPGINGRQLAESLSVLKPELHVLYMSGYTADLIAQHGILDPNVVLLEKPFTKEALLRKVRKALDGGYLSKAASAT
jgi:two-component system cell cycle sensor histidine kinase/response regulator CckA